MAPVRAGIVTTRWAGAERMSSVGSTRRAPSNECSVRPTAPPESTMTSPRAASPILEHGYPAEQVRLIHEMRFTISPFCWAAASHPISSEDRPRQKARLKPCSFILNWARLRSGTSMNATLPAPSREQLLHALYEAAELEHNLMCTYLYAAFSLRDGESEGLSAAEAEAVTRWRRAITDVAIEEMGHLSAIWNITSALGGSPRFGRLNFPLDPGGLPANVVVRLAPFDESVLQHFIYLERPALSNEPDGEGFKPDFVFQRGVARNRITPMPVDYETVGHFYEKLSKDLKDFVT